MPQELGLEGCDFCKFVNYEDSDDFYLYEMGTCKCKPLYSYTHLVKNRIIIHFVLSGKGILKLNGKTYEVGPHQVFLIPSDTKTFYQADKDDPWEYAWFHIGGPKIPLILKEAGLTPTNPVYTPMACADKIETLVWDIMENNSRQYYCIGTLYQILGYMIENSKAKQDDTFDDSLLYVKNVISYIQLKYTESIKIEKIASSLGLNRSYLTRLFKEATGYSPQEYLLTYRMKMAMKMLSENELSVSEVATAVGYGDTFTFSKAFKRHFGKSPSECRGADYSMAPGMTGR
ncbi:MAG: AraC family transcriptional regulator [Lachnospiraceae bacterium]|nr:AraC family transcriptional regulator [Lachnospiraceae bacterium]